LFSAATLVLVAPMALAGCTEHIEGSGRLAEQRRDVAPFTGISVERGLHVEATVGPPSVVVVIDDNLVTRVRTSVSEGTLVVDVPDDVDIDPSDWAIIRVSSPTLARASASNGSRLDVLSASATSFQGRATSGSSLEIRAADTSDSDLAASGGSSVRMLGVAQSLRVSATGGSEILAPASTENLEVLASGGSRVEATAWMSARGKASGGSSVVVSGVPKERAIGATDGSSVVYRR
jgi:hypothetical protein